MLEFMSSNIYIKCSNFPSKPILTACYKFYNMVISFSFGSKVLVNCIFLSILLIYLSCQMHCCCQMHKVVLILLICIQLVIMPFLSFFILIIYICTPHKGKFEQPINMCKDDKHHYKIRNNFDM